MAIDTIILTEPTSCDDFYPFHILHSIWEIRCGALRIFEKYQHLFPDTQIRFAGREMHLNSFLAREGLTNEIPENGSALIIDSSVIPNNDFINLVQDITHEHENAEIKINDKTAAIYIHDISSIIKVDWSNFIENFSHEQNNRITVYELKNHKKLNYLWDAIFFNGSEIEDDFQYFKTKLNIVNPADFQQAVFIEPEKILIGENSKIAPFCVIDASHGAVIIGSNVNIMPHSTILGPCFIGDNSLIKIGAKIYHDCSFGEFCKIGGELENTIVHSYSNKQHDGFLGHSYLCEWVNLGADTNNSDLKNTYGDIVIRFEHKRINTGRMFLGLLCGDHTKSGINSMFTTGTAAGICSVLVESGFLPGYIRSFSWGGGKDSKVNNIDAAIDVARKVMNRRGKTLLKEEELLLRDEYTKITSFVAP